MIGKRKRSPFAAFIWGLAIGLPLLMFTSCISNRGVSHYMPNEAYMMNLTDKGMLKVAGSYLDDRPRFQSNLLRQINAQIAYSPINHLGFIGSFYHASDRGADNPYRNKNTNYEFAVGYYHRGFIRKDTDRNYFLHDFYMGFGSGNSFLQGYNSTDISTTYQRFFIHYGFHSSFRRFFRFGGGIRYVFLHFDTLDVRGKTSTYFDNGIRQLRNDNNLGFPEVSFQMQAGTKDVKLFYTLTWIMPVHGGDRHKIFVDDSVMNLGLVFDVHKLWKKSSNP